jgi:radical SAM superfamily enzyme YgiQ (UPF0313 family)
MADTAIPKRFRCLLINPEVRAKSFWNYDGILKFRGAKHPSAPIGLITVAAMLPRDWELKLIDRLVEPLDDAFLDWADLVMIGGLLFQQPDHLELIHRAKARGKRVVSGGPDATSNPHLYDQADHLVLGEAEVTLPRFLADFARGEVAHIYRPEGPANMADSPVPRWDLLHIPNYFFTGLQWSRGCPFNCEFCDIIELFGRVPRLKSPAQVLAELQNLYDLGWRGAIDIVDDNFVGNRQASRKLVQALESWQAAHGWPFEFGVQASLNLADDRELMRAMQRAGFSQIFVGIETTDQNALVGANKKVNTRRDVVESIRLFYAHGMFAPAGFILGFDQEGEGVADQILDCIDRSAIPVCMVGLLSAMRNTQLARRLEREGRLEWDGKITEEMGGDQGSAGLNFQTVRPKADILSDYIRVLETIYSPQAYFDRITRMALALDLSQRHLPPGWKSLWLDTKTFAGIVKAVSQRPWARLYGKLLARVLIENPRAIRYASWFGAMYLHIEEYSATTVKHARARIDGERISRETGAANTELGAAGQRSNGGWRLRRGYPAGAP